MVGCPLLLSYCSCRSSGVAQRWVKEPFLCDAGVPGERIRQRVQHFFKLRLGQEAWHVEIDGRSQVQ
ncbi:MAG: hypothetical protein H6R04_1038 [Burkholderiaceae bacterium]|nr:hypothetical protein [Burkholderiaceae bacterium]